MENDDVSLPIVLDSSGYLLSRIVNHDPVNPVHPV